MQVEEHHRQGGEPDHDAQADVDDKDPPGQIRRREVVREPRSPGGHQGEGEGTARGERPDGKHQPLFGEPSPPHHNDVAHLPPRPTPEP